SPAHILTVGECRNNSLRVTLEVTPAFTSERTVVNYPKDDMTSLLLSSSGSSTSVLVRVINVGLAGADGRERVGVETSANVTSSSLIIAIDHFVDDPAYHPGTYHTYLTWCRQLC